MMVGRFIYKSWRKSRTVYAVTNQRIISLTAGRSLNVQAAFFDTIPGINFSRRASGAGTLIFGNLPWGGMWLRELGNGELQSWVEQRCRFLRRPRRGSGV